MRSDPIFISHASKDDQFVKELRQALEGQELSVWRALISKLQAILHGARDPALAEDPALDFDDAAELALLLEGLLSAD